MSQSEAQPLPAGVQNQLAAMPPQPAADPWVGFIERAMRDASFDVGKLSALLDERRKEQADERRQAFNRDLADAQSEMEPVLRTTDNPAVRRKYATLEALDADARPIYTRHGFSIRFGSAEPPAPGMVRITCTVAHNGGWSETHYLDSHVSGAGSQGGRTAMTPVQAVGAVVTYLRRYLLAMVFHLVTADITGPDTDGRLTVDRPPPPPPPRSGNGRSRDDENWVQDLRVKLAQAQSAAGVDAIGESTDVKVALERAPQWVRDEITTALADALERVLGAVRVPGEDKLGAG